MTQYVGIIQQGMVLKQRVVAERAREKDALDAAKKAAKELNDQQTGFGEGWAAVALPVPG